MVKKIISFSLLIFFFLNSLVFSSNDFIDDEKTVFFPPTLGAITDMYDGLPNKPLVLIVQNIHCHSEAQKSIKESVKFLKDYYKDKLKIIGVEGDVGYINTNIISDIPNLVLRESVVDDLLERSLITGHEAYSSLYPAEISLYGLEDWTIYSKSISKLKKGVVRYNGWQKEYTGCRNWLNNLEAKVFNDKVKKVYAIEGSYKKNQIGLGEFLFRIGSAYKRYKGENDLIKKYPNIVIYLNNYYRFRSIDVEALATEKVHVTNSVKTYLTRNESDLLKSLKVKGDDIGYDRLVKALLKKKNISVKSSFPSVYKYYLYLDAEEAIDKVKLVTEIDNYVYAIKYNLANDDKEKNIVFIDRNLDIVSLYIENNISPDAYEYFELNKDKFFALLKKLYNGSTKKIEEKIGVMREFYNLAIKRSEILVSNLLKYKGKVLLLVVGGFYKGSVSENLRNRGCSYKIIIPYIREGKESKSIYLSRLQGKVLDYDVPVIASCIYTKEFRNTFADVLMKKFVTLYSAKKIDDKTVTNNMNYVSKIAIENFKEKEFMKVIVKLVNAGYKDGFSGTKKEIARSIAIKTDLEPPIIEDVLEKH